ncbi:hypothetical protein PSTG_11631 [Puccinia striiformis f. sp. tritici PST-78]|uniref:Uncharacterized protein n=1 Tax=Puccinia striiformis f. sp. tritici PST-78 TaxID=1165861 RepID=A0A0L0V7T6_9BASI|nr:hypothetical protein PSTG_11631 [Puccinia striiformis f. sp. tritici PST-78]
MLKALASCPNRVTCAINSALGMLGQRSLEVYLISAGVALGLEGIGIWDQRKHDPAAYNYSPSFQAVPQTFDFANPFELHASEWAAAITSTSHSGSGTKSDGSSIAYLLMPSSSKNPLLSSMFNDPEVQSSPTSLNNNVTNTTNIDEFHLDEIDQKIEFLSIDFILHD